MNLCVEFKNIFFGPCYIDDAYKTLNPLFRTAIKIRYNVGSAGNEAVSSVTEKIKDATKVDKVAVVIILAQNTLDDLYKMLNE